MSLAAPYPSQLAFQADHHIARWRPLVQWLLVIPHLAVAQVLSSLRNILTLISFVTVLFTEQIPRPLFDMIAMTYRYEWRAVSYALFLHEDYPPFDFLPTAVDDGVEPHTTLTISYPEHLNRWAPLYKWLLAVPHYLVGMVLAVAAVFTVVWGLVAVVATGRYPDAARDFLVGTYRYWLRINVYVGLLTDEYPPFSL
jgi:Domain of unknown function (DUF4389)